MTIYGNANFLSLIPFHPCYLQSLLLTRYLQAVKVLTAHNTIRLFLHTVTVRLFEALKLNRYNVTYAKPLNILNPTPLIKNNCERSKPHRRVGWCISLVYIYIYIYIYICIHGIYIYIFGPTWNPRKRAKHKRKAS